MWSSANAVLLIAVGFSASALLSNSLSLAMGQPERQYTSVEERMDVWMNDLLVAIDTYDRTDNRVMRFSFSGQKQALAFDARCFYQKSIHWVMQGEEPDMDRALVRAGSECIRENNSRQFSVRRANNRLSASPQKLEALLGAVRAETAVIARWSWEYCVSQADKPFVGGYRQVTAPSPAEVVSQNKSFGSAVTACLQPLLNPPNEDPVAIEGSYTLPIAPPIAQ